MNLAVNMALTSDTEAETPLRPVDLEAVEIESRSISLRWSPPSNQRSLRSIVYYIFYREEESTRYEKAVLQALIHHHDRAFLGNERPILPATLLF